MTLEQVAARLKAMQAEWFTDPTCAAIGSIRLCQAILGDYLRPDSGQSADDCINKVLRVLDDRQFVTLLGKEVKANG